MHSDFRILGTVEVLQDGDLVDLGSPRQRELLARLLIDPGRLVTGDRLVEDLWPGQPPESARHALHVYMSRLRKALGPDRDRLESRASGYVLKIEPHEVDASRFDHLASEGREARARGDAEVASALLREALDIWRGPALAEFCDEAFAREESVRLGQVRLGTLEERIWADLELGRHVDVIEELQELAAAHPFREGFAEQLMLALYRSGRQAAALRAFQTTRTHLAKELGIEPGPALRRLEQRVLAQDPTLDVALPAKPRGLRLPLQRTSFIGRQLELAKAAQLLGKARLITMTGPPGSGKTRLALRLASNHHRSFPHGSFFVPLTTVTDPHMVTPEIARVLDLRERPGESALEGLKAFLRDRRCLLVIDNFEQILGAAPDIGQLIDAAPEVTILVTSRSPLRLAGEQEFPVPPLRIPPLDVPLEIPELASYDAVNLFVARSRASDPDFGLNAGNTAAVTEIIARLDGLPLAIELAAARLKVLTPQELVSRLEQRLGVLTGGPADTDVRHRTMRDAIDWSYGLLEPDEQTAFRRLGVFLGGFTLEAASEVVDLPDFDILDGIGSLLSSGLLYRPVDVGRARFAMFEVLREFALERLHLAGEHEDASRRHAAYFLRLTREAEPQLAHDPGPIGVERLSAETDNIRGALRHAVATHNADLGLSLASSIWRFWQSTNQLIEGRYWLRRLLEEPNSSAPARARGLTALGGLAYWSADYEGALAHYAEALDLYRSEGDRYNEADTRYSLSLTANWKGDLETGQQHAEAARSLFEQIGSAKDVAKVLMAQAFVLWRRKNIAAARTLWEESIEIARDTGDQTLANTQLVGLAGLAFQQGERTEALRIVLEAVEEATELRNDHVTVWMLDFVAAFTAGNAPDAAVRLAGAVDSLRQEAGGGILPASLDIDDARTVASQYLDTVEVERAWHEGRLLTLEEAIEQAHQLERLVAMGRNET